MGQDGNTPGFPDDAAGVLEAHSFFGYIAGPSLAQITPERLFVVFYQPLPHEEFRDVGPSDGRTLGQIPEFVVTGPESQIPKTQEHFPVPLFPASRQIPQGFMESLARFVDSQPKQVECPTGRDAARLRLPGNFQFHPGDKPDAEPFRRASRFFKPRDGIMVGQSQGADAAGGGGFEKFRRAQGTVGYV
jgi:hypothetical protein